MSKHKKHHKSLRERALVAYSKFKAAMLFPRGSAEKDPKQALKRDRGFLIGFICVALKVRPQEILFKIIDEQVNAFVEGYRFRRCATGGLLFHRDKCDECGNAYTQSFNTLIEFGRILSGDNICAYCDIRNGRY